MKRKITQIVTQTQQKSSDTSVPENTYLKIAPDGIIVSPHFKSITHRWNDFACQCIVIRLFHRDVYIL